MRPAFCNHLLLLSLVCPLAGQENPSLPAADITTVPDWEAKGELGASAFFGNTSQFAVTTAISGEADKGILDLTGRFAFAYGESANKLGETVMSKRAWEITSDVNLEVGASFKGFLLGKIESAYEKKIDLRYNMGAGGKYQGDFQGMETEWSFALLAEKTLPLEEELFLIERKMVGKWSAGFAFSKILRDGWLTIESDLSVEPEIQRLSSFTLSSRQSVSFQLSQSMAIQFSFVDSFDSGAQARGARSNNDGQVFFSLVSTFR
ncbi:MAG TPA: DUF481 domain-containing protein [Gemmatimonadetes bacterium]|jgi:hypothetical protein|nr:DUF481 domain-containing protein [Gemmatimonadota bacterium]